MTSASIHHMFDLTFSQEKDTIDHIARFWEPRVRDFPPSVYLDHYTNTKAVCHEIKETRRRMRREFRAMNMQQKDEYMDFRNRFKDDFHNPTLIIEGLNAFAADCYLDIRDNSIIQLEWRRDHFSAPDLPISYE